ncbi:Xre family transcriptional regulator [Bifidobacterium saguini DSM 23967]|uniref:Xre family transcriptional regulator n=3 Tax=Bifidobacterium saguini TaxID=762210 RepID=A0A087DDB1_9BIFI|nr:Xre family transcriptional regulator [Bifidobacterium saguini DSM 23967]QTB92095.1 helix-turn-helix transcriptional regulator [Bifidobacterium saguini]
MNSPMKEWLSDHGISYRKLAAEMGQSHASIAMKVNGDVAWQQKDLLFLHDRYGLSSDFVIGISVPLYEKIPAGGGGAMV